MTGAATATHTEYRLSDGAWGSVRVHVKGLEAEVERLRAENETLRENPRAFNCDEKHCGPLLAAEARIAGALSACNDIDRLPPHVTGSMIAMLSAYRQAVQAIRAALDSEVHKCDGMCTRTVGSRCGLGGGGTSRGSAPAARHGAAKWSTRLVAVAAFGFRGPRPRCRSERPRDCGVVRSNNRRHVVRGRCATSATLNPISCAPMVEPNPHCG